MFTCSLVQVFLVIAEVDVFCTNRPMCAGLYLTIVILCSPFSHQNSSAEDGDGSSGGYVPRDTGEASEGSEAGDDHTDGDAGSDEEGQLRCEKCENDFDADSLRECALCNELYCQDCLECEPLGEEVRYSWSAI